MVDMMSGGRLVFGVGSGYLAHEFVGYGQRSQGEARPLQREPRHRQAPAWPARRCRYKGQFSKSEKVVLNVLPHHGRVPPIYVAVLAREAAYHVGKQGTASSPCPMPRARTSTTSARCWRNSARAAPRRGCQPKTTITSSCCTPMSRKRDEEAREQCKAAYDLYVDTRLYAKKHVYEDILANGICLFGSVETVAEKMCRAARDGHPPRRHDAQFRRAWPRTGRALDDALRARGDAAGGARVGARRWR